MKTSVSLKYSANSWLYHFNNVRMNSIFKNLFFYAIISPTEVGCVFVFGRICQLCADVLYHQRIRAASYLSFPWLPVTLDRDVTNKLGDNTFLSVYFSGINILIFRNVQRTVVLFISTFFAAFLYFSICNIFKIRWYVYFYNVSIIFSNVNARIQIFNAAG